MPGSPDLTDGSHNADSEVAQTTATEEPADDVLEATRTLKESLATDPQMIDTTLRNGLGMTPSHGGLFAWANSVGSREIIEWLQPFQPLGKRFEPTHLLLEAAKDGSPIGGRTVIAV